MDEYTADEIVAEIAASVGPGMATVVRQAFNEGHSPDEVIRMLISAANAIVERT